MPVPPSVGASGSGVMVMVLVRVLLKAAPTASEFASVTCQVMVRLVLLAVGSSEVELNFTDCKAVV